MPPSQFSNKLIERNRQLVEEFYIEPPDGDDLILGSFIKDTTECNQTKKRSKEKKLNGYKDVFTLIYVFIVYKLLVKKLIYKWPYLYIKT